MSAARTIGASLLVTVLGVLSGIPLVQANVNAVLILKALHRHDRLSLRSLGEAGVSPIVWPESRGVAEVGCGVAVLDAKARLLAGDVAAARDRLTALEGRCRLSVPDRLLQGIAYQRSGQSVQAVRLLTSIQAAPFFLNASRAARRQSWCHQAVDGGTMAVLLMAGQPDAHVVLAEAFIGCGRPELAVPEIRRAIASRGDTPAATYWSGWLARQAGDGERAAEEWTATLTASPEDYRTLMSLGELRLEQGMPAEATVCFQRASTVDPGAAEPRFGLGRASLERSQFRDAAAHFAIAVERGPNEPGYRLYLARALDRSGDAARARAVYRDASSAVSARPDLLWYWLEEGRYLERTGEPAEAVAVYRRFLTLFPDAPQRAEVAKRLLALAPS